MEKQIWHVIINPSGEPIAMFKNEDHAKAMKKTLSHLLQEKLTIEPWTFNIKK